MQDKKLSGLIIEDNTSMREATETILRKAGYAMQSAETARAGLDLLANHVIDFVITDYKLPDVDGLTLLKQIKEKNPEIEVMVITAFGTIDLVIDAMKAGAWDFVTKPFSKDALILKVDRLATVLLQKKETHHLREEHTYLKQEISSRFRPHTMIGASKAMKQVYKLIDKVAGQETTVFIHGESGTGKELVAQAIHLASARKERPFIRVNCSALAESLLESELFGHEKGAFTGAIRTKKGRFELADGGTLFMDEIGDIPASTQVKLLRVLQEKTFERVGGEESIQVDVRLVTATNRNLPDMVKQNQFREDLYYRLHVFPLDLPPLRERKEDIKALAEHFLNRIATERGLNAFTLTKPAEEKLLAYNWPGNVRELENVLERATVLAESNEVTEETLGFLSGNKKGTDLAIDTLDLEANVAALEKELIQNALNTAKGNKSKAARLLNIKETTLHYKLDKYNLR